MGQMTQKQWGSLVTCPRLQCELMRSQGTGLLVYLPLHQMWYLTHSYVVNLYRTHTGQSTKKKVTVIMVQFQMTKLNSGEQGPNPDLTSDSRTLLDNHRVTFHFTGFLSLGIGKNTVASPVLFCSLCYQINNGKSMNFAVKLCVPQAKRAKLLAFIKVLLAT